MNDNREAGLAPSGFDQAQCWGWWAGRDEEEYTLAGPCALRSIAIDEAYGDTEPGDFIYLVEAVCAPEDQRDAEGIIPFVKTRKRSHVIRKADRPNTNNKQENVR